MSQLDEEILVCAHAIRPALPALLGAEAAGVEREITRILSHQYSPPISATLLLELLRHYESTRRWAQQFLAHERDALCGRLEQSTYQPWLGAYLRIPPGTESRFCPVCGFRWFRSHAAAIPPPSVPMMGRRPSRSLPTGQMGRSRVSAVRHAQRGEDTHRA